MENFTGLYRDVIENPFLVELPLSDGRMVHFNLAQMVCFSKGTKGNTILKMSDGEQYDLAVAMDDFFDILFSVYNEHIFIRSYEPISTVDSLL